MKKILLSAVLIFTIGFSNAHIERAGPVGSITEENKPSHKVINAVKELTSVSTISHFVSPALMNSLQ